MISMDGMLFVAFDLLGSLQQIRFAAQICRNRYPNHPTSFGRNLSSSWICVPPRIKTEEGLSSPTSRGVPLGAAIPAGELSGAGSAAGQARCHHHSRPRRESQPCVGWCDQLRSRRSLKSPVYAGLLIQGDHLFLNDNFFWGQWWLINREGLINPTLTLSCTALLKRNPLRTAFRSWWFSASIFTFHQDWRRRRSWRRWNLEFGPFRSSLKLSVTSWKRSWSIFWTLAAGHSWAVHKSFSLGNIGGPNLNIYVCTYIIIYILYYIHPKNINQELSTADYSGIKIWSLRWLAMHLMCFWQLLDLVRCFWRMKLHTHVASSNKMSQ